MSSAENKAVFLSYASQDAEAVKRICDALRAASVEVWFDQNELVGGDAWDAKIRKQIKECALFVPIISSATQARTEGYFRLEWRLADQRTHLMAKGRPFLLPVVIDDTRDADAQVPDSFTEVQWTRLPGGEAAEKFSERVKKLLDGEAPAVAGGLAGPGRTPAAARPAAVKSRLWLGSMVTGAVLLAAGVAYFSLRPSGAPAEAAKPAANAPAISTDKPLPAAQMTEARKLAQQARALIDDDLLAGRENFRLAEELARKATVLDPTDGEVWGTLARVLVGIWSRNYDATLPLREQARSAVERATRLAPTSVESGLAACDYQSMNGQDAEAERIARETLARFPTDHRCLRQLATACVAVNKGPEALELWHRSEAMNGGDPKALVSEAFYFRSKTQFADAEEAADRSLALAPTMGGYQLKLLVLFTLDELDRAQLVVEQIPARLQQEDVFASLMAQFWIFRGEPDKALEVLERVPRDFFEEQRQYLPKGWLTGWAMQLAGRPMAAKSEWEQALMVVEKRLQAEPSRRDLILYRSRLLALLGRRAEADAAVQLALELNGKDKVGAAISMANVRVCAGDNDGAITLLVAAVSDPGELIGHGLLLNLKHHPMYAPIRHDPRIQKLLAAGDERLRQLKAGGRSQPGSTSLAAPVIDEKSVAVLAFTNLSDDKANEYFSDGISEELLTVLQKIPGLHVAARTSAFSFKGKNATAQEIGAKLGVANLVEGSVQKSGNRVKITARLSRVATGEELWSESYTRELKDVFALQEELAAAIVGELRGQLGGAVAVDRAKVQAQVESAIRGGTKNVEAYQLYLQGRYVVNQFSSENFARAIEYYRQAVRLDPAFALGWAALSRALSLQWIWGSPEGLIADLIRDSKQAADRALALEPNLAEGYAARFEMQLVYDFDWKGAAISARRALELAPSDAINVNNLSRLTMALGDAAGAIAQGRQAVALDPLNTEILVNLAVNLNQARRFREAEEVCRRALVLNPSAGVFHSELALSALFQGRFEEALALAREEKERWARFRIEVSALWAMGRKPEAAAAFQQYREEYASIAPRLMADVYAYQHDSDQAFLWLDRTFGAHDLGLDWVKTDPFFDKLHADPRWVAFLHKAGLADDQLK